MHDTAAIHTALQTHPGCCFVQPFLSTFPHAGLYVVGGAVRDLLLGRTGKDVDFVVTGLSGEILAAWLETQGQVNFVGKQFGVYKFLPQGIHPTPEAFVDIALPRTERATEGNAGGYREFDVHPDAQTPIEADLARRDFTVNAMAYDTRLQTLVDPFNGQDDLEAKCLRAVGNPDARFAEDLSRILRGIRFATQLDFEVEPTTWEAMRQHVPELSRRHHSATGSGDFIVPRETIGRELAKTLAAHPYVGARLLRESGALAICLPPLKDYLSDERYLLPLRVGPPGLLATLALLLRGLPAERVSHILESTGFTSLPSESSLRVQGEDATWIVGRLHQSPGTPMTLSGSVFERTYLNERGNAYLEALRALGHAATVRAVREREASIRVRWGTGRIPPLLTGRDVTGLGIPPGPSVRRWLERVRDEQLEGKLGSHEEALRWLKRAISSLPET